MTTISEFEELAKTHSANRVALGSAISKGHKGINDAFARHVPRVQAATDAAAESRAALERAVENNPDLFVKPKTMVLHGIKFGFAKNKGSLEFTDEEKVIGRIERLLPKLAKNLIKTTRKIVKKQVAKLTVQDAKKIGVRIVNPEDEVVVSIPNDSLSKLALAFLAEREQ